MNADLSVLEKNLRKRGFNFAFFDDEKDAISYILQLIPEKSSIGFGGSQTVTETGLLTSLLSANQYDILHRDVCKYDNIEDLFLKMHSADWYITSTNAICQTGDMVNIDGRANRVAAMLNGPHNVIVICGINKLVPDIEAGIERVRNVASPANCRRLHRNTPCAYTGKCEHCNSPETICNATVIQHHPTSGSNVHVVMINKYFGF